MFSDDVGAHRIPLASTLKFAQTKGSLATFIDTPPIRAIDAATPGFNLAVSHDLDVEGDWRGWALYADFGDGYTFLAEGDIPASMGTATTTLGTVTNIVPLDTVNSVTFTLDYVDAVPDFSTVTAPDLVANPYRNLFLVGNEYVQAATITDNGGRSFTISNLYRGRFDTRVADLAHTASERVILINGAEKFVPMELSRLDIAYNYKVVTTNQNLADATPISLTWTGNNVKATAPTSVNIFQDASGDWTVQVLGAPSSQFVVELWNSTYTEKKATYNLLPGIAHAAMLEGADYTAGVTVIDNIATLTQRTWGDKNNIFGADVTGQENFLATARTIEQIIETGSIVDFTFHGVSTDTSVNGGSGAFAIGDASLAPGESTVSLFRLYCSVTKNPVQETLFVQEFGVLKKAVGGPLDWEIRFSVVFSGGELRVYRNRRGNNDEPLYVATRLPANFPLRLFFMCSWKAAITGISIQSIPSTVIASRDQVIYFGSVQSRLYTRIYALSPLLNNAPGFPVDIIAPPL